jgi:hypothetical protein
MPPHTLSTVATLTGSDPVTLMPTPYPKTNLARQASESDYVVILSITRDYTTYTTTIILGGTETPPPSPDTPTDPQSPSSTAGAASSSTISTPIVIYPSTDPTPNAIIGAIVGCTVGAFVFAFLMWICCYPASFRKFFSTCLSACVSDSRSSNASGSRATSSSGSFIEVAEVPPPHPPPLYRPPPQGPPHGVAVVDAGAIRHGRVRIRGDQVQDNEGRLGRRVR